MYTRCKVIIQAAVLASLGGAVHAQQVDYTGLESVFGEPVTVSATGKPQRVSQTPVSMTILPSEEIRSSGAIDIPQLLRRVPGVNVVRNFRGSVDVSIRGYNEAYSNRVLVLVNGRQVYQDNFGMTLWESIPVQMNEIKQIEVVRGPNTSLFGFNAASGVINIVTFNPLYDDVDIAEVAAGTHDYQKASLVASHTLSDKWGVRTSLGGTHSDGFSRDALSPRPSGQDALESRSLYLDSQYDISDHTGARVEVGYNNMSGDQLLPYNTQLDSHIITRSAKVRVNHNTEHMGLWTIQAYHNQSQYKTDSLRFGLLSLPSTENNLNVLQVANLFSIGADHTFRLGGEYRNNALDTITQSDFEMDIASLNGMWNWEVTNQWAFTAAVRADYWETERAGGIQLGQPILGVTAEQSDRNELEYSYNLGLTYAPTKNDSYRLSLARGIRVPSLVELAQVSPGPTSDLYGNPNLDTEKNTTIELGYNRKLEQLDANVGANLFYQQLEDVIGRTIYPSSATNILSDFTFENIGDSRSYGMELFANGDLLENKKLHWFANYSLSLVDDDALPNPFYKMGYEDSQPEHKISLGASYTHDSWQFDADGHYISPTDFNSLINDSLAPSVNIERDGYFLLNARVGYNLSDATTLALSGYNLLEKHNERPTINRRSLLHFNHSGGIELGRALMFTVRHSF